MNVISKRNLRRLPRAILGPHAAKLLDALVALRPAPMSLSFPLFFQPTFTQGLIIGQLSIILFLGAILKYLFFEPGQAELLQNASYGQQDNDTFLRQRNLHAQKETAKEDIPDFETTEWLNALLKQVVSKFSHVYAVRLSCPAY